MNNHPLTFASINWEKIGWVCDNCFEVFSIKKSGFYCKICKDYYICISCFKNNEISKEEFKNNNFRIRKKDENMGLFVFHESEEINETKDKFNKKSQIKNENDNNYQRRPNNYNIHTRENNQNRDIKIENNNDCKKIKKCLIYGCLASTIVLLSLAILFGRYYLI